MAVFGTTTLILVWITIFAEDLLPLHLQDTRFALAKVEYVVADCFRNLHPIAILSVCCTWIVCPYTGTEVVCQFYAPRKSFSSKRLYRKLIGSQLTA